MTEVNGALGVPGTGGGNAAASQKKLDETFDNFLTLLTTQLQHQDPLSPMDSTKFTEQLVQFTNVEQSIAQTKKLDELLTQNRFNSTAQAVGFIGKDVEVFGEFVTIGEDGLNDGANMTYALARDAAETKIKIVDKDGVVVRELRGAVGGGAHELDWDGRDENGNAVAAGTYQVIVSAVDAAGEEVGTAGRTEGRVQSVRSLDGTTYLDLGGAEVPLEDIISIREPAQGSSNTAT